MKSVATKSHKAITVTGHDLYASLMAELNRVAISQRIKEAREQSGLTQVELADALHVHTNTVANWERPAQKITPWDRLAEIASWTGVSRDWLIHGEPQEEDPQALLRVSIVDALRALEESQEDVLERLIRIDGSLSRLEAGLSKLTGLDSTPGTGSAGRSD